MNRLSVTSFAIATVLTSLVSGCATKKPKPMLHRGWIGGEFLTAESRKWKTWSHHETLDAFPADLESKQVAAVFVSNVYSNTPLAVAGVQPGDLILSVGERQVRDRGSLYDIINKSKPGSTVSLSVYRDGQTQEHSVLVGQENYQKWRTLTFGLIFTLKVDGIPNPDFSLIALGYEHDPNRPELRSPQTGFVRTCKSESEGTEKPKPIAETPVAGESSRFWLIVFGLGSRKDIFSQEIVEAQKQK